jgi:hypothetical protein
MKKIIWILIALPFLGYSQVSWEPTALTTGLVYKMKINKGIWAFDYENHFTTNNGETWTQLVNDSLVVWAYQGNLMVAGHSQDYQRKFISTNDGLAWKSISMAVGNFDALEINNQDIFHSHDNKILKSSDHGASWQTVLSEPFISMVCLDSVIMITTPSNVFKSINGGTTWLPLNTGLTVTSDPQWLTYAGHALYLMDIESVIFRSVDMGRTWTPLPMNGLKLGRRNCLAATGNRVFVSGYSYGDKGSEKYNGIFELVLGENEWHWLINDSVTHTESMIVHNNYLFAEQHNAGVIRLDLSHLSTGLTTYSKPDVLKIAPNPCDGRFTICVHNGEKAVRIINLTGSEVSTQYIPPGQKDVMINTSDLPAGLYIISTGEGSETRTARFSVQH